MDMLGTVMVGFLTLVIVVVGGVWIALLVDRLAEGRQAQRDAPASPETADPTQTAAPRG